MSTPPDNTTSSTVKKQTRRFAPTIRGRGRGRSASNEVLPSGSEDTSVAATPAVPVETSAANQASSSNSAIQIGHIHSSEPSDGRLPSIHGQKTRGGAAKMKFKPTIPAKRNKKEVSQTQEVKTEHDKGDQFGGQRGGRGSGRGRGGRGRGGRGRGRGQVVHEVTASGIFSLGPAAMSSRARAGMAATGGAFATYGGDTTRAEKDDGTETDMNVLFADTHDGYTPVVFPHVPRLAGDLDPADLTHPKGKIPWLTVTSTKEATKEETAKVEKEDEDLVKVKPEKLEDNNAMLTDTPSLADEEDDAKIKVTDIKKDDDITMNDDTPAIAVDTVKWMMNEDAPAQNIFAVNDKNQVVSVADDELLFFQLPTIVPTFTKIEDEMDDVLKSEDNEGDRDKSKELPLPAQKLSLVDKMAAMDLSEMPEGQIGKLVVYKSGKMKLRIGNVLLDVDQGMRSSFLENVMSVDPESKKAIELGHIVQKFTCIPNMDALLENEENK